MSNERPRLHNLKTNRESFEALQAGKKSFEVRKNDRGFKKGDWVYLQEFHNNKKTGRCISPLKIKYILEGVQYGIEEGYCVFCWYNYECADIEEDLGEKWYLEIEPIG